MGYSARYHATSLIAVFLALAVGILIGAEFGGDALTQTRKNLENSLVGNLQDARSHVEDLNGELGNANEFDEKVYPVLTRDRLQGQRIALIAFGNLPGEITSAVEDALGPTGAKLVDAKGVSRLYRPSSTLMPVIFFVVAFLVLVTILIITSPALNDVFELFWLKVRIWLGI